MKNKKKNRNLKKIDRKEEVSEKKINFLVDTPLEKKDLNLMQFGHDSLANTISKIAESAKTPFTIGLFGKWGVGKSTIVNKTKENLITKKIPTVIFDVWKHKDDALRRTFLAECKDQIDEQKGFEELFKLDDRVQINSSEERRENKMNWKLLGIFTLFFLIFFSFLQLSLNNYDLNLFLSTSIINIIISFILAFLIICLKHFSTFTTTKVKTNYYDRYSDPHHFEEEFGRLLSSIKSKRILIVFDNLDRVEKHKSSEILSTIKTFLEPKDMEDESKSVIFLIPCDDQAIIDHIHNTLKPNSNGKGDKEDSQEFLNKFFNCILEIPPFIDSELEKYTLESLNKTNYKFFKDNEQIAWLLIKAFRKNPRKVKQFINALLANCLLIEGRSGVGKDFQKDFLKKNILPLTKFMIIKQRYSKDLNKIIENGKNNLNYDDILQENGISHDFLEFIRQTDNIKVKDLDVFFSLRRSEFERKISGIDSLFENMVTQNEKQMFLDFNNLEIKNPEDFNSIIKEYLRKRHLKEFARSFINSLFLISQKNNLILSETTYTEIYNKLSGFNFESFGLFSPKLVFNEFVLKSDGKAKTLFHKKALEVLNEKNKDFKLSDEKRLEWIELIGNKNLDLKEEDKVIIIDQALHHQTTKEFILKNDKTKNFLNSEIIEMFTSSKENVLTKMDFINIINQNKKTDKSIKSVVQEINLIIKKEGNFDSPILIKNDNLFKFIRQNSNYYLKNKENESILENIDLIISLDNHFETEEEKVQLLPIYLELLSFVDAPKQNALRPHLNKYLNYSFEILKEQIDKIDFNKLFSDSELLITLTNKCIGDDEYFDMVFNNLKNDKLRGQIFEQIFEKDMTAFFRLSKKIKYNFPNKKKLLTSAFEKIDVNHSLLENLMRMGIEGNFCKDFTIETNFNKKIIDLFSSNNSDLQDKAINWFKEAGISKEGKRDLIKKIIDFLNTKKDQTEDYVKIYQILLDATSSLKKLTKEEKNGLIQFCFDVIRTNSNMVVINQHFEILEKLKPMYFKRKENFIDIKNRLQDESNLEIKKEILKRMLKLNKGSSKEEKEYRKELVKMKKK